MSVADCKIFLTGGTGFIGKALASRLVANNKVTLFDNGHRDATQGMPLPEHPNLETIQGDVLDAKAVQKAVKGHDVVIHLASIANVDSVLRAPVLTMKVALLGTFNVIDALLEADQVDRFIDFSTSEVFGSYAYKLREEDATSLGAVGEARWTYAVSKLATEHLANNCFKEYGLPSVSIRPFNIYGPGQVGAAAILNFIQRAIRNEELLVHGDGAQIRAWCYIDDIVNGVMLCIEKPEAVGQSFNIGNPRSVCTIHSLAQEVVQHSGSTSKIRFVDWNQADVELRIPNIDKARRLLGFEPVVDLKEGILRTVDWYRNRQASRKVAA